MTNEFLNVFKNSSLALSIGVLELTSRTRGVADYSSHAISVRLRQRDLCGHQFSNT